MSPPAGSAKGGWKDLVNGAVLQCVEAATLGMPFEVWKTRMGRFRNESTVRAFFAVMEKGGGPLAFWQGTSAKMVESATKGAVLLYSKELILTAMTSAGCSETLAGFAAGAGGGVCQTVVMGPCTFLVTAAVTGEGKVSVTQKAAEVWAKQGIKGFYPGGTAIAFRQATNWASRQGITEFIRSQMKVRLHGDKDAKLTVPQEACAGILGGALSTWNQPFEVARIQMQSAANEGKPKENLLQVLRTVVRNDGVAGLFQGIVPRIGLGVWQTLFMVTGAKLLRQYMVW